MIRDVVLQLAGWTAFAGLVVLVGIIAWAIGTSGRKP